MTIKNNGSTPDRLISGSADVASRFELHEMKMEGSVAKMRQVKGGLEIKPGETVELQPGSFHVMFVGLKKPLSAVLCGRKPEPHRARGNLGFGIVPQRTRSGIHTTRAISSSAEMGKSEPVTLTPSDFDSSRAEFPHLGRLLFRPRLCGLHLRGAIDLGLLE
jgi:hypothetical protein